MALSRSEVRRIASLARIRLTEAEEERFEKDLSSVLAFVEELSAVDTEGIEPLSGGTDLDTVMRQDDSDRGEVLEGDSARLLDAAPEKKNGRIKVPTVF